MNPAVEGKASVAIVQKALAEWMSGNPEGYLANVHDDFKGDIMSGVLDGGAQLRGKQALIDLLPAMSDQLEVLSFKPDNYVGAGNSVYFTVDWEFVVKSTGKKVSTRATVLKKIVDGKICEKYHRVNADQILKGYAPHMPSFEANPADLDAEKNVQFVKDAVGAYMAGKPEEYIAACHDDFCGDIWSGIIPGGENIRGKEALVAMFGEIGNHIEVKKFEPKNWAGVANYVFFEVDWEFVVKKTGKTVATTGLVLKIVKDQKICFKHHRLNNAEVVF